MALFGSKKNTTPAKADKAAKPEKKVSKKAESKKPVTAQPVTGEFSHIIKRPRITEKASMSSAQGVYAFEVAETANKRTIAAAIQMLYNVKPVKVAVARIAAKKVMLKGRPGVKKGGKKAYVYLKKGETIEFV
jgi:large subunit ribosomal protein L23